MRLARDSSDQEKTTAAASTARPSIIDDMDDGMPLPTIARPYVPTFDADDGPVHGRKSLESSIDCGARCSFAANLPPARPSSDSVDDSASIGAHLPPTSRKFRIRTRAARGFVPLSAGTELESSASAGCREHEDVEASDRGRDLRLLVRILVLSAAAVFAIAVTLLAVEGVYDQRVDESDADHDKAHAPSPLVRRPPPLVTVNDPDARLPPSLVASIVTLRESDFASPPLLPAPLPPPLPPPPSPSAPPLRPPPLRPPLHANEPQAPPAVPRALAAAGPVLADINHRFTNGGPDSMGLAAAGVLLHAFDGADGFDLREDLWRPCPSRLGWCGTFNRYSVSLTNRRLGGRVFNDFGGAGFVLNSHALEPGDIMCGFAFDAGTMGSSGCPSAACPIAGGFCWWRGDQLQDLLGQHEENIRNSHVNCAEEFGDMKACYNELVISGDNWVAKLPRIVHAIFYPAALANDPTNAARMLAERVHHAFLAEFGLRTTEVPLLTYDYRHLSTPFALAPSSGARRRD